VDREQDILQIRKYLNGELNARAMHELERRALDDPFLMDALEGFKHISGDQDANLAQLTDRLNRRAGKREGRIIPWISLSAAASILIILGAGIWFFTRKQDSEKAKSVVAQNVVAEKKEHPAVLAPAINTDTSKQQKSVGIAKIGNSKIIPDNNKKKDKKSDQANGVLRELSVAKAKVNPQASANISAFGDNKPPLSSEPVGYDKSTGYYTPKKDSVTPNEMLVRDIAKNKKENIAFNPRPAASTQTLVQSSVNGVSVIPDDSRTVTGMVIGNDGVPITGATVKVLGRNFGAVTDVNGKFVLPDVAKGQILSVNYIGYSAKKIKADKDSMSISLDPVNSSLAEVVVTHENAKKDGTKTEDAHPSDGWNTFDDYLKKNAQSSDGKTGKVKVSFVVAADGSLNQFKITKSLSDAADKKAISLVSGGPAWTGGTDNKPKGVTITVKFH
jgi:cytoskeletal protein RodZ